MEITLAQFEAVKKHVAETMGAPIGYEVGRVNNQVVILQYWYFDEPQLSDCIFVAMADMHDNGRLMEVEPDNLPEPFKLRIDHTMRFSADITHCIVCGHACTCERCKKYPKKTPILTIQYQTQYTVTSH